MSRPYEVPVAPATAEGFAPFGTVIGAPGLTPDYKAEHLAGWRVRYESEGETIFLVMIAVR